MKKDKKKNKSIGKWVFAIVVLVMIFSIVINEVITQKQNELNIDGYNNLLSTDTEKLVLLKTGDCSKCKSYYEVLKTINDKENMEIYTINVNSLSKTDYATLLASSSLINKDKLPSIVYISGGSVINVYTGAANYDDIVKMTDMFTKTTVQDYLELAKKDEESYIYIGRPTCVHCVNSMPRLKRIIHETGKPIYYINIDNESSADLQTLTTETKVYTGGTPLFMVVKNGEILRNHSGEDTYEGLKSFFEGTATE